jgi:hypothetical protein
VEISPNYNYHQSAHYEFSGLLKRRGKEESMGRLSHVLVDGSDGLKGSLLSSLVVGNGDLADFHGECLKFCGRKVLMRKNDVNLANFKVESSEFLCKKLTAFYGIHR